MGWKCFQIGMIFLKLWSIGSRGGWIGVWTTHSDDTWKPNLIHEIKFLEWFCFLWKYIPWEGQDAVVWMVSIHVLFCHLKCGVVFWVLVLLYFLFKSEIRKSETQCQFNNEVSLLNLIDCALFRSKIFCEVKVLADSLDSWGPFPESPDN